MKILDLIAAAVALAISSAAIVAMAQERGSHAGAQAGAAPPVATAPASTIASLTDQEIADLYTGKGMGFARAAEINGYPGPAHVLELAAELTLTPEQKAKVQAVFDGMKRSALALGPAVVAAEQKLDQAFRAGGMDRAKLAELVGVAEKARAELRLVHLAAHLETTPLLTAGQRQKYDELRGHAAARSGPPRRGSGSD